MGRQSPAAPFFLPNFPASMTRYLLPILFAFSSASAVPTPAEKKIEIAQARIEKMPEQASSYPPLAFAYAARARETADGEFYTKGMEAAQKALELEPGIFDGEKAEIWILLGQHDFQKAYTKAVALNKRNGDDPMVYSLLTDAAIETGRYDEAEKAAQWALDLAPGAATSLTRAAYLRELFGDFDGSIDLMRSAFNTLRPTDVEDRAWLLTQIGHLYLLKGDAEASIRAHEEALKMFPGYHYALLNLAHAKAAQGKYKEAVELHRKHFATAGHPENRYELAVALRKAGMDEEADKEFAIFEKEGLGESKNVDNANRELTAFYIDEAKNPKEALRIANLEMANRQDYLTLYAYARALHANGEFKEAQKQMEKALAVGVKIPEMQAHAATIAKDAGKKAE